MSDSQKRKILTMKDKVDVIHAVKRGLSSRRVAEKFKCGKTQICSIMANKDKIMAEFESGAMSSDRCMLSTVRQQFPEVNSKTYDWFCEARAKNCPVSGPLIQEKAKSIAENLKFDTFTASNGWLESFQKRHGIHQSILNGESADVDNSIVEGWFGRLKAICEGYSPDNIYNCDETGLFYRALPTRSLVQRNDKCKGGKFSKERLTVLLTASLTGHKLQPLVIGKSRNPRCFNKKYLQG